jgi:raffinose/stachyose/melibiose transport system permease protein
MTVNAKKLHHGGAGKTSVKQYGMAVRRGAMMNLMYVPALCMMGFFIVYPFLKGIRVSFTDWNGYAQTSNWVGLDNYIRLFQERDMISTILNTLIYGFGSTILQNVLGLSYALLLDKRLKGSNLVRTIVYMPTMISGLIMGYIWYFMLNYNSGALKDIFDLFHYAPGDLLTKGKLTVVIIMLVNVFAGTGTTMIFYQAGLQSISAEYYEAAMLDGAGSWTSFWKITLPLLIPSLEFNVVLNLIGSFKLFDMIKSLTNGGPASTTESLATMMYRLYFSREQAGYASALGNVMTLMIVVISLSALIFIRRREVEI